MNILPRGCQKNDCTGIAPDSRSYSLQDALYFNGTPVTVVVTCPPGANCVPGTYPATITYPPGTFVFPNVPQVPGELIFLSLEGCQETVSRTLPAGSSPSLIQQAVNDIIALVAAQQAQCDSFPDFPFGTEITLGGFGTYACLGSSYSDSITAFVDPVSGYPVTFGIIGGSLPTGVTMTTSVGTSAEFSGTPAVAGDYSFTLRGTTSNGVSATRTYGVSVAGITTASPLPEATAGEPYSVTLAATGFAGTLLWGIASGELPSGLELNTATGEIFGVPTTEDTYSFIIFVQGGGRQCAKVFELVVAALAVCGELFADTIWGQISSFQDNGATTVASGTGTDFDSVSTSPAAEAFCVTPTEVIRGTFRDFEGIISYTGPEVECCLRATVAGTAYYNNAVAPGIGATSTCSGYVQVYVDGGAILMDQDFFDNTNNGTFDYSFTIPECLVPTNIVVASGTSANTSATTDLSCFYPDQTAPQAQMTIAIRLGVC
jgi:hypothetical protein